MINKCFFVLLVILGLILTRVTMVGSDIYSIIIVVPGRLIPFLFSDVEIIQSTPAIRRSADGRMALKATEIQTLILLQIFGYYGYWNQKWHATIRLLSYWIPIYHTDSFFQQSITNICRTLVHPVLIGLSRLCKNNLNCSICMQLMRL